MANKPEIMDLVDRTKVIFIGTVQRLGASSVATYRVTSHTVIAVINRVLRAPAALGDLQGQRITIELTSAPGVRPGERAVFFTNGLAYADSLAVEEVGRIVLPEDSTASQARIAEIVDALQRQPDRLVQSRIATADVVVTGKVVAVRTPPNPARKPLSEHDPDWREAVIEVQAVENGLPMKQVLVLFPASNDVRWYACPKFSVGQEGVWILHRHSVQDVRSEGYTALDPADFHPKPSRNRIRAIIQGR